MIKIENLSKQFGKTKALNNLSFSLPKTGLCIILGPSGCGKTTLLNCLSLLINFEGKIEIDGTDLSKLSEREKADYRLLNFGFVFQDYKLYENDTVINNVLFPLDINSGMAQHLKIRKALDILSLVGLENKKDQLCKKLSGGEKQRVAIARSLINNPKIILADEPTGSLDNKNSIEIMELITQISKHSLVIMVSHDQILAKQYANEIIFMKDGNIVNHQYNNAITTHNNHLMINIGRNTVKKPKISFGFLLRHTWSCLKERKWRTIICNSITSLGLIGIGLSFSISDTLSGTIKSVYSSIIDESKLMVDSSDIPFSNNIYFASYNQASDLGIEFKHLIDDIGIFYLTDYQNYFEFESLNIQKNQQQIPGLKFSDINEFLWLDDFPSIKIYPSRPKILNDDEIILSLTIDMIQSICFSLQISRTVSSLSNYISENDFLIYYSFSNPSWNYYDEQLLKVKGFVLNTFSGFYHTNHLWNEIMYENNMRLTTIDNMNNIKNPWDLRKIYYLKSSHMESLLTESRLNSSFSNYSLELASNKYYQKLFKNTKSCNVDRAFLFINKTDIIKPSLIPFFNESSDNLSSPIFGSNGGYAIFPDYLMMGFSKTTFFSFDDVLLDETIDANSYINLESDETISLPPGICEGHFSKSLSDGVTFSCLSDRDLNKYKVKSTNDIVISSSLRNELLKSNNNNENILYLSFAKEERILLNGKTIRSFETSKINIKGIIDSDKKMIYHSSSWPLVFFQYQIGVSIFDLGVNAISFNLKNPNKINKTISEVSKAFPSYRVFNPLNDLNTGIEETCYFVQIALIIFSLVATLISIVLLYLSNYLFLIERKKDVGIAQCIGVSKNESKRFLYCYSFVNCMISFLFSFIELFIATSIMSYFLADSFNVGISLSINPIAIIAMLILSFSISFLSSFFLSKKYKKYSPFELLND